MTFCRRYNPPIDLTDDPYTILIARQAVHEDEAYGATRAVVDLALRGNGQPFDIQAALTPQWVLPFPTDGGAVRDLTGTLVEGEEFSFRMEISTPHEMAEIEVACLARAGRCQVLLLGWDAV